MTLPTTALAAVTAGQGRAELREFPLPPPAADAGWLRVEVAGVCGSDVEAYATAYSPRVVGHENVGVVAALGPVAARRWGVGEGDRVVLEEYLPCGHCAQCWSSEFRLCRAGDPSASPGALRYGATAVSVAPALWGGQAEYLYLHPNSVFHRLDAAVPGVVASMALQLGNGFQWVCRESGAGPGRSAIVFGLAEKGLSCVLAAVAAGCDRVVGVATGDADAGIRGAELLGAHATVRAGDGDTGVVEAVRAALGGEEADIVVDTAGSPRATPAEAVALLGRGATLALGAPPGTALAPTDLRAITKKQIVLRGVRGHSYEAVEWAIDTIASGRYPLADLCAPPCGLDEVDRALSGVAAASAARIHACVVPTVGDGSGRP